MRAITIPCPECGAEIELRCEYNAADIYGQDADGNRGIAIPAYLELDDEVPDVCPDAECGHTFTPAERASLETDAHRKCENWSGE